MLSLYIYLVNIMRKIRSYESKRRPENLSVHSFRLPLFTFTQLRKFCPKSVKEIRWFDSKIHRLISIVEIVSILPPPFEDSGKILSNRRSQVLKLENVNNL